MDTLDRNTPFASNKQSLKTPNQKFSTLAHKTEKILFQTKAVFPFDFFPDELTVDLNKVNIVYKEFFFAEQVYPILLSNIEGVVVESSLLFATLRIEVIRFLEAPFKIRYLRNHEAYRAKRIITGLVACIKEGVDPATVNINYLINNVERIGSGTDTA